MSILPRPTHTHIDAVSDKDIARALIDNNGLQYLAAEELNLSATWLGLRIKRSEYLQQVREACIQLRIDKAERQLANMVESGNFPAVALTLRTLGRSRGYVETGNSAHPADVMKAFDATMSLWADRQKEIQGEVEELPSDLNNDDTSMSNDN